MPLKFVRLSEQVAFSLNSYHPKDYDASLFQTLNFSSNMRSRKSRKAPKVEDDSERSSENDNGARKMVTRAAASSQDINLRTRPHRAPQIADESDDEAGGNNAPESDESSEMIVIKKKRKWIIHSLAGHQH